MGLKDRLDDWIARHNKARAALFEVMDKIGEQARAGDHHGMVMMGHKLEHAGTETEIAHRVVMTLREVIAEEQQSSRGAAMVERARACERRQHAVDVMNTAISAFATDPTNASKRLSADKAVEAWKMATTAWERANTNLSDIDPVLFGDPT